eukprot:2798186-Amphidinium_carterae.1
MVCSSMSTLACWASSSSLKNRSTRLEGPEDQRVRRPSHCSTQSRLSNFLCPNLRGVQGTKVREAEDAAQLAQLSRTYALKSLEKAQFTAFRCCLLGT